MNIWLEVLKSNDFIGVKQCIKKRLNLNDENDMGESVLASAIRYQCDEDIIDILIDSGADIFDFDNEGVSIFDMAITYDNVSIVKHILNAGIDVNKTRRRSDFTPLMCAASYGRKEIVKILLDAGANKEAKDLKGFTAIDFARKMNKKSLLVMLCLNEDYPANKVHTR